MRNTVLWNVTPFNLVKFTDVLRECTDSIFMDDEDKQEISNRGSKHVSQKIVLCYNIL